MMTSEQKKFLKEIKKAEILNEISDLRYFLRMAVEYGSKPWKDLIAESYLNLRIMFKNRHNFRVLKKEKW